MPAAPEVLNTLREIRLPEVDHEVKSHELRAATRDAAVAAKVSIYLPRKCIHAKQRHRQTRLAERSSEGGVCDERTVIGNNAFSKQTFENQQQPGKCLLRIPLSGFLYLWQKMRRPLNWPGDQMREQTDK